MAADGGWFRTQVGGHPVSVELRGPVETEDTESSWGAFGTAKTTALRAHVEGSELAATATVVPAWALRGAGNELVFMTTRDTFLRKRKGKARSWRSVERRGLKGKRLEYEIRSGTATGQTGTMEVYVMSPYILTFDAVSTDPSAAPTLDHFFSSIQVRNTP
jgi:hypothetical protein